MSNSVFKDITPAPPIEVFLLTKLYNECKSDKKVNLGVGAYRSDEGKPWVLPVVHTAEVQMANDLTLNHEYLPVAGLPGFRQAAVKLMLGPEHKVISEGRYEAFQSLGGTGALRLAAAFLKNVLGIEKVFVSNPTWGNHKGIFKGAGFTSICEYRYFDSATCSLDLHGMLEDLGNAPEGSAVILHAVAHNPTGVDPTQEQWKQIQQMCAERKLMVVMDCAYQGFATGNLEADAWAVRYFANQNIDMFICQSFSKNFGLYNERIGNCVVVSTQADKIAEIRSQMEIQIRIMWSNPSNHGALIVGTILNNAALYTQWKENVTLMADRIKTMRQDLVANLRDLGTPGNWTHITKQIGMFSYTGLTEKQVEMMKKEYNIFLLNSGRMSLAGLTSKNVAYVAQAMDAAVRAYPTVQASIIHPHLPESSFMTFVEYARRKLEEGDATLVRTNVVIEGVMEAEEEELPKPESSEPFVKVRLNGSMTSVDNEEAPNSVSGGGGGKLDEETTHDEATGGYDTTTSRGSVKTQPGTLRDSVKTYQTTSSQTDRPEEDSKVPATFEGTMLTPVYFKGMMISPKKLQEILLQAGQSTELSLPVSFKGGMLTAAFRQFSRTKDESVPVKFKGELSGLQHGSPDLPVLFEGNIAPKKKDIVTDT